MGKKLKKTSDLILADVTTDPHSGTGVDTHGGTDTDPHSGTSAASGFMDSDYEAEGWGTEQKIVHGSTWQTIKSFNTTSPGDSISLTHIKAKIKLGASGGAEDIQLRVVWGGNQIGYGYTRLDSTLNEFWICVLTPHSISGVLMIQGRCRGTSAEVWVQGAFEIWYMKKHTHTMADPSNHIVTDPSDHTTTQPGDHEVAAYGHPH